MKPEDFVAASEAARINGISRQRVCRLAKQGRIPGAARLSGGAWMIPAGWRCPRRAERKEK
jgi:hypothetical protein